jgi:hypothetical protein
VSRDEGALLKPKCSRLRPHEHGAEIRVPVDRGARGLDLAGMDRAGRHARIRLRSCKPSLTRSYDPFPPALLALSGRNCGKREEAPAVTAGALGFPRSREDPQGPNDGHSGRLSPTFRVREGASPARGPTLESGGRRVSGGKGTWRAERVGSLLPDPSRLRPTDRARSAPRGNPISEERLVVPLGSRARAGFVSETSSRRRVRRAPS